MLDLLEGVKRKKFQEDFTSELVRACAEKHVTVHSAFIRSIDIPEEYLKQVRDKQIAVQRTLTNKAKEATAKTNAEVEEAKQMVELEVRKVEADTKRLVAVIDSQVDNLGATTEGELGRMRAVTQADVAMLEGQRDRLIGEAEAGAEKLKETARSSLAKLKMEVFQGDGQSFLRYALSEKLRPDLQLRLFQSGPGTFWTNMSGSEGMNLLLQPNKECPHLLLQNADHVEKHPSLSRGLLPDDLAGRLHAPCPLPAAGILHNRLEPSCLTRRKLAPRCVVGDGHGDFVELRRVSAVADRVQRVGVGARTRIRVPPATEGEHGGQQDADQPQIHAPLHDGHTL